VLQDLYREHFDPILRAEELDRGFSFDELVQRYGGELARADLLIFVHPDWWGQPPALLKGWIDRVLRPGVAYDNLTPDEVTRLHVPLLTGKRALVFCPTDAETAPPSLDVLWRRGVFEFCGISDARVSILTDVRGSTHARRQAWLNDVEASVTAAIGALARGPTGR
jgi:putative NADPH-quinone reductase